MSPRIYSLLHICSSVYVTKSTGAIIMKTHISLNVSSIAESVEFYKKMFGLEPFKLKSDYAKFDVENPPLNLTMNQANFEKGGSLSHLGLQVESTEEVMSIGKRWQQNGLITLDE